jgi:3-(3-hydroxy-phenyl)propionate hydroxylase
VLTALGLAQCGVSVTLLDAADAILAEPRGMTYHWAALAGLIALDIAAGQSSRGASARGGTDR